MANVTYSAIAKYTDPIQHGLDGHDFYVEYVDVSGSMWIEQSLCALTIPNLYILTRVVIEDNINNISLEIKSGIIQIFMNGTWNESFTVLLSLTAFAVNQTKEFSIYSFSENLIICKITACD